MTMLTVLGAGSAACRTMSAKNGATDLKIDSAHAIGVDATISAGVIMSSASDKASWEYEVKQQLWYVVGQLNGEYGGAADMNTLVISVDETLVEKVGDLYKVPYAAKMLAAWPREKAMPETYNVILPRGGDSASLEAFFTKYDHKCVESGAHDYDSSIFWYYYRPLQSGCPLAAGVDAAFAVSLPMQMAPSTKNTEGKSPEYTKVWEDKQLVVTAIFGQAEDGEATEWDAGVSAINGTYRKLVQTYGTPKSSSVTLAANERLAPKNKEIELAWDLPDGKELKVWLSLVEGIRLVGPEFNAKYNAWTKTSDFVAYSGHSGLGANIRALARKGEFVQGQYQLFLVNGCDTFAYVDGALRDAHGAANPGSGKDKYFDIITNAMPSYFHMNPTSVMTVVDAMVGQKETYRELLSHFDEAQRAVVTGEEDNAFPNPF
jgi:hypothetical protein